MLRNNGVMHMMYIVSWRWDNEWRMLAIEYDLEIWVCGANGSNKFSGQYDVIKAKPVP